MRPKLGIPENIQTCSTTSLIQNYLGTPKTMALLCTHFDLLMLLSPLQY